MNLHQHGYLRVASVVPQCQVADIKHNTAAIIDLWQQAHKSEVDMVVFPELCITGYSCADLFLQQTLLNASALALASLAEKSEDMSGCLAWVGAPLVYNGRIYNCAVAIADGRILAAIPKRHLPNYNEFYEQRWFETGASVPEGATIRIDGGEIPFGCDIMLDYTLNDTAVPMCAEICEDLWTPIPPSSEMAMQGALVVVNLSASNELTGKHQYLADLIRMQSARIRGAYIYASAGWGESSTDVVYAGNAIVAEDGVMLKEGERFSTKPQLSVADIDIARLQSDRTRFGTFADHKPTKNIRHIAVRTYDKTPDELLRYVDPMPFVPRNPATLNDRCREIIDIQTFGLMRRLDFTHCKHLVVGVSGGLDSTLALLVTFEAFRRLELPLSGICAITMPGFGTTDRTYHNALQMMKLLGVEVKEISIAKAVTQHFEDIGQDINNHDVTYENGQARERTQILMDYANKIGGMVLGTGDLSELALGWCTYNGDHMSMYAVNASVPKTLVRHLVRWFANNTDNAELRDTLMDVIDTPISPELTPADEQGNIKQKTEDLVGPYELHDFYLYHTLRYGATPERILMLAEIAFKGQYTHETIKKWLKTFYRRFFSQQFKRSCMPDGPKVGSVCLSPRGDWRMPSDASATEWLAGI